VPELIEHTLVYRFGRLAETLLTIEHVGEGVKIDGGVATLRELADDGWELAFLHRAFEAEIVAALDHARERISIVSLRRFRGDAALAGRWAAGADVAMRAVAARTIH